MSDQTDIDMGTDDAGIGEGSSKGGISGLLLKILKWVAICFGVLIFIVTIVVITVNIMGLAGRSTTSVPVSEDYVPLQEPLEWHQAVGLVQTRSSDIMPAAILVEVALGYTQGDRNTMTELSSRLVELRDFLRSFFHEKTMLELQNEGRLKIEIRNYINDNILTRTRIRDVRFTRFDVIEQ